MSVLISNRVSLSFCAFAYFMFALVLLWFCCYGSVVTALLLWLSIFRLHVFIFDRVQTMQLAVCNKTVLFI